MKDFADTIAWPVALADRRRINGDLDGARNVTMEALIGLPRGTFGPDRQPPTNPALVALLKTADLGPFAVTGLAPAVAALRNILADVKAAQPALHARLGTADMLCCRWARGSTSLISNHAWGIAIDLTIDGQDDARGDEAVQHALLDLLPHFRYHGFFWGAAYRSEDAMHFEASDQLVRCWAGAGLLEPGADQGGGLSATGLRAVGLPRGLTLGDRGPKVEALQLALNARTGLGISVDGDFGPITRAAVIAFQHREGLAPDGLASRRTRSALGL